MDIAEIIRRETTIATEKYSPGGAIFALMIPSYPAFAWDGVDNQTGESIEIDSGNLVRSGRNIEIYDHSSGTYEDVEVHSIHRKEGTVEVEVYDYDSGEYRTFDMEED